MIARIRIFLYFIKIGVIRFYYEIIHIIVVVAVFRRIINQHFLYFLAFRRLEIVQNRIPKLLARNFLFFINEFFNSSQRIRHIRNTDLQTGNKIVYRAAFFNCLAAADAVIRQCGA